jgi:hypothetical protein
MFAAPKRGEKYDDCEKQELNNIMPRELSIDIPHGQFSILGRLLFTDGLKQQCSSPAEHSTENGTVYDKDGEENELCDQPSLIIPVKLRSEVSIVNIADSCDQKGQCHEGRKEADSPSPSAHIKLEVQILFFDNFPIEGPSTENNDKDESYRNDVKKETIRSVHRRLASKWGCV